MPVPDEAPEEQPDTARIGERIDKSEFERVLQERKIESQVSKAEITAADPHEFKYRGEMTTALRLEVQTVSGMTREELLPEPQDWDPQVSDLVAVFQFTAATPNDLDSLEGERVPFTPDVGVHYGVIREVLHESRDSKADWDFSRRMDRAEKLLEERR